MEFLRNNKDLKIIKGDTSKRTLNVEQIRDLVQTAVKDLNHSKENRMISIHGIIHKIRQMSDFAFVILRNSRELVQCVYSGEKAKFNLSELMEGDSVIVHGEAVPDERSSLGFEVHMSDVDIKSRPAEKFPVVINKKGLDVSLDTNLSYRPLTLRNPRERAILKIQEGIARGFRDCLLKENFTEVRTPKIVFAGAEGGANIFKMDYFGKNVYLAQSPQFYKQTLVGVYENVFEVGPVFRAEKHNTSRHLNEYTSMDFEMGFIDGFEDVMNMETKVLKYIMELLKEEYRNELNLMNAKLPEIDGIPTVKFMEAKDIISNKFKREITDYGDFEPEEEKLLGKYFKKKYDSDFVFVTHYPSQKRPFYAMDDRNDPGYTLSFDLLLNGLEVTTGGQRIHDYFEQVDKMRDRGMNPEDFETYLMLHKYGIPPHGGLGAGLERLTMKLLDLPNVRNATFFPRDVDRVTP